MSSSTSLFTEGWVLKSSNVPPLLGVVSSSEVATMGRRPGIGIERTEMMTLKITNVENRDTIKER